MERENYKQCNCSTTVNTCICILIFVYLNIYTNVIAPAYLYDIIIFFILCFDDVYCFGINAALASTVLAQSSITQVSSDTFAFFPQPLLHLEVIRDTILAGPLIVYMGVNDLFITSIPSWMGSITVLPMFALSGMFDGSVDVQLLWLVVTWRKEPQNLLDLLVY
ncbi:hypothetical protein AVEN_248098-1 [Araneus ventricosus]|uniref:Uncharacterized protein n=1 Tax=Araneus ventricosus TaxID=182803 RepID=A0A4Y2NA69_ARAVE|nr:hypothetical protein AVEN_248098-1 [Araneus ventricosus]